MNEVITTTGRSISTVTTEIRTITRQTQQLMLSAAIEIGRRLQEAKSLVPHGEWGAYLRDEVEFSQSTANNFMRIYEEYGDQQESLFSVNSQALTNLPYTKALRLLAVPAEERAEFVEKNDVENKSTRELEQLIRERDAALQEKGEIAVLLEESEGELIERDQEIAEKDAALKEAQTQLQAALGDKTAAEAAVKKAEKDAAAAGKQVEKLKKDLERASKAEQVALSQLQKHKENPEVPAEVMEKMRQEAEAKAVEGVRKELEAKLREAEGAAKEAQQKLETMQKEAKLQNPDAAVFKALFDQVQADFDKLVKQLQKITGEDPAAGQRLKGAVNALLDSFRARVEKE